MNPFCLIRGLWYSIRWGEWISGHAYKTIAEKTPENVHVCQCEVCGHISVVWGWKSLEKFK